MDRTQRILLSLWICWHAAAVTGSALRDDVPAIKWFRDNVTRSYELAFGVHQNWNMFSPNPPRSTTWLRIAGQKGREVVVLAPLDGEPDPNGVLWTYERESKYDRNASVKRRRTLRKGYVRWLCRTHDLDRVQMWAVQLQTPKPGQARTDRSTWERKEKDLGSRKCK